MHLKLYSTLLFCFALVLAAGQTPLDRYIAQALESNIALQQKELSYAKSLAALQEAKATFLPVVSFNARYSMARGGRTIDIPIGDLVNPVYQNLNVINQFGSSLSDVYPDIPAYPMLENVHEPFLRRQEHETTVQVVMPIFNTVILQNHRIKENLARVEQISVDMYKRELVKEVKTGYFNYLKASEAEVLYQNVLKLVNENLRTSQSLFDNNKVTIDEVYAAEAQVKEIEQQLTITEKNKTVAQAYFNFLLNRNYDEAIETGESELTLANVVSLEEARQTAVQNREELKQLSYYMAVAEHKIKLDKGGYLPNLAFAGNYGFQGTDYSFGKDDDFVMGSLVLSWDLFNRQTPARVQQSEIDKDITAKRWEEAQQQIGLQVVQAFHEVQAALKGIELAEAQVESADKAFRLVNRKYSQGQANLVQITDSRTRLTNSEQQLIIAKYDYQIRIAELEAAMATYAF